MIKLRMWLCKWQCTKAHPANSTVAQLAICKKIDCTCTNVSGGNLEYVLHLVTGPVE